MEALRRAQRDLGGGGCFVDRDDKPLIDWGVLSAIAALVVAFGALAYVLGLLAMWFPASKETHDFALSWYATSLVPQTTVAGIGVRWTLVGSHLLFVFFSFHSCSWCHGSTVYTKSNISITLNPLRLGLWPLIWV